MAQPYHATSGHKKAFLDTKQRRQATLAFSLIAALFPALAILGRVLDIPLVARGLPSLPYMVFNTAVGLCLASAVLATSAFVSWRVNRFLFAVVGALVFLLGFSVLVEHSFSVDLGIDQALTTAYVDPGNPSSERPSPQTAFNFMLLGFSMLAIGTGLNGIPAQLAELTMGANALISGTGYIFSEKHSYGFPFFASTTGMALHTSASFISLTLALLLTAPNVGVMQLLMCHTRSGKIARQIGFAAIIFPPILGLFTKLGVAWGFYDLTSQVTLFTSLLMGTILFVTWQVTRKAQTEELRAERAFQIVSETNARLVSLSRENEQLNRESQRAKTVVDNLPAMIAFWDSEQRCAFANRAYIDWFGVTPQYLVGRTMLELLGPELYARNLPHIEGALRGEKQFFERDLTLKSTGERKHANAVYIPSIENGKVAGFFVLVTDVTELKNAQLMAITEKEHALAAIETREDVLAIISHDLRNPLSAISMAAQLLMEAEKQDLDEVRDYAKRIGRSVTQMQRLINDLLDFGKLKSGTFTLARERAKPGPIIHDSIEALRSLAEAKNQDLVTEVPAILSDIECDASRLEQVILNLLGNAIKFTPIGGRLTISASPVQDGVMFSIADTGPGIEADNLPHIFERFWQAKETHHLGSGLGLAIAKGIVDAHGGRIWAESVRGQGSRFFFVIPYATVKLMDKEAKP